MFGWPSFPLSAVPRPRERPRVPRTLCCSRTTARGGLARGRGELLQGLLRLCMVLLCLLFSLGSGWWMGIPTTGHHLLQLMDTLLESTDLLLNLWSPRLGVQSMEVLLMLHQLHLSLLSHCLCPWSLCTGWWLGGCSHGMASSSSIWVGCCSIPFSSCWSHSWMGGGSWLLLPVVRIVHVVGMRPSLGHSRVPHLGVHLWMGRVSWVGIALRWVSPWVGRGRGLAWLHGSGWLAWLLARIHLWVGVSLGRVSLGEPRWVATTHSSLLLVGHWVVAHGSHSLHGVHPGPAHSSCSSCSGCSLRLGLARPLLLGRRARGGLGLWRRRHLLWGYVHVGVLHVHVLHVG